MKKSLILIFEGNTSSLESIKEFENDLIKKGFNVKEYRTEEFDINILLQLLIEFGGYILDILAVCELIHQLLKKNKDLLIKNRTTNKVLTHNTSKKEIEEELKKIYREAAF